MTRIEMFAAAALVAGAAFSAEPGFTDLFDGKTLDGWKTNGGSAEYREAAAKIFGEICRLGNFERTLPAPEKDENA